MSGHFNKLGITVGAFICAVSLLSAPVKGDDLWQNCCCAAIGEGCESPIMGQCRPECFLMEGCLVSCCQPDCRVPESQSGDSGVSSPQDEGPLMGDGEGQAATDTDSNESVAAGESQALADQVIWGALLVVAFLVAVPLITARRRPSA